MKKIQNGFTIVEVLLVVVVVGLLGTIGWLVYDKMNNEKATKADTSQETKKEDSKQVAKELDFKTVDGIKYTLPSGWRSVKAPFEPYEADGHFLLSPDYSEAGLGVLSIKAGGYIHFKDLEWTGIDSSTNVEQAASVIKNGEGGYLDTNSVKVTTISGKQVVTFDAGHTTDGVTVLYKTESGKWLDTSFATSDGNDAEYNAQDNPHYTTFMSWLADFFKLNP